jgi:uncharacterized protein YbbC (DUF1343 family)
MKNSNFNITLYGLLKYAKLLCIKSFLLLYLSACNLPIHLPRQYKGPVETVVLTICEDSLSNEVIEEEHRKQELKSPVLGIERMYLYLDSLKGKRIAIVGNQTSMIGAVHLVDTLLALKVDVRKVFAPEHGFRGDADAGERIHSSKDPKTGLPIVSLYGNNKKPQPSQLEDVDVVIYDIQDVGVRFYTYISTLHYVMEACAEQQKQLLVLDRPNPNGHYVDGPVREEEFKSFIGMHPVPIVYGMTIGEYAMMINGEGWLHDKLACKLWVIPCKYYTHKTKYVLPVPPSPNLKSEAAVSLYPSLCLFEATTVSVGRGTERPFEVYGHPNFPKGKFEFTPISRVGAKSPLYENRLCQGLDLHDAQVKRKYELNLTYLIHAHEVLCDNYAYIDQIGFFNRLAGTASLREQILAGWSAKEIRATWKPGLDKFKQIRSNYLLYN